MSAEREIDKIIDEDQEVQFQDEPQEAVALAAQEVATIRHRGLIRNDLCWDWNSQVVGGMPLRFSKI